MQVEHTNVFYFKSINKIGGVESFFYYLSKLYSNMVVYYRDANPEQVKRLSKRIEVHKWHGETIKCKRFFGNYGLDILDYIDAEEKYFVIHCDYKKNKVCKPLVYPGFKYIAVSKLAGESFKELTGLDYEVIYNPVALDIPNVKKKEGIHIICAMRMSGEKGGWRIDKFTEEMDKRGIDYDLTIYTNKPKKIKFTSKNVILKEPKLDLTKEMKESTFLIQPSDHEAFGLSVCESLTLGTPVIITDLPAFREIGCNEDNSIFLDMNMLNVGEVIDKVVKGIKPFTYTPPKSNWGKYLDNKKQYNPDKMVEVKVLKKYTDIFLKKKLERYKITQQLETMPISRAAYLEAKGYVEW